MSSNKQEIIEHQGRTGEGARPLSGGGGLVRLGRSGGGGREGSPGLVLPRRPKRMSVGALFLLLFLLPPPPSLPPSSSFLLLSSSPLFLLLLRRRERGRRRRWRRRRRRWRGLPACVCACVQCVWAGWAGGVKSPRRVPPI